MKLRCQTFFVFIPFCCPNIIFKRKSYKKFYYSCLRYTQTLTRELVSFLNKNGGQIYIGITDYGKVVGVSDEQLDETQRMNSDCITNQIEPNPQSEIKSELIFIEGKRIILISVNKGFKAIYCIKKYGFFQKDV